MLRSVLLDGRLSEVSRLRNQVPVLGLHQRSEEAHDLFVGHGAEPDALRAFRDGHWFALRSAVMASFRVS